MSNYYPPVSFYFQVNIHGMSTEHDSGFLEVDGLTVEREVVPIQEGGENRFMHRLPGSLKYQNLILKRGLVVKSSQLAQWCLDVFEPSFEKPLTPRDIDVSLLDEQGSPLVTWNFKRAWPIKWKIDSLGAMDNKIAIETLEFVFSYFTRTA
ncbi:MAG: phage tail protein [Methylococcaceae bacterium]|nr:phage tail protein [Methylococcaceae bacterium]